MIAGHPTPEVEARLAQPDEIPASATRLATLAREHGWIVVVTYARGTRLGAKKVSDSIAVRMRRGSQRVTALWVDGAFSTAVRQAPMAVLNSREVIAYVKEEAP